MRWSRGGVGGCLARREAFQRGRDRAGGGLRDDWGEGHDFWPSDGDREYAVRFRLRLSRNAMFSPVAAGAAERRRE